MFLKFHTSFLASFTASLLQLESAMTSTVTSHLVDLVASNHMLVATVDKLDGQVSSFENRLTTVKSSLAEVAQSTTTMVACLQDMGASLTSFLAHPPPITQNPSPVTPTPASAAKGVAGSPSTADGPTLDVPDGAVNGLSPPQDSPLGVQWTSTTGNRGTNVDPNSFSSGD